MLRREPWRILFPLGTLLAWAGVVPWLLFALRLKSAYEPLYSVLGYRAFLHPLAELEGFLLCFGAGLLFTLLRPRPAAWQTAVALLSPIACVVLTAAGDWQAAQAAALVDAVVMLEFALRRAPRSPSALWIPYGLLLGAAGALIASFSEAGRDLVMQGMFAAMAIGTARMLRGDDRMHWALHAVAAAAFAVSFWVGPRFGQHLGLALRGLACVAVARPLRPEWDFGPANLRRGFAHIALWLLAMGFLWAALALGVRRAGLHVIFLGCFAALLFAAFAQARVERRVLAVAAAMMALSMMARAMVELDPTSFHLWMGLSAGSFLISTALCGFLGQSV